MKKKRTFFRDVEETRKQKVQEPNEDNNIIRTLSLRKKQARDEEMTDIEGGNETKSGSQKTQRYVNHRLVGILKNQKMLVVCVSLFSF